MLYQNMLDWMPGLNGLKLVESYTDLMWLNQNEPRHDKTKKVSVRPEKTQISLGIHPVLMCS